MSGTPSQSSARSADQVDLAELDELLDPLSRQVLWLPRTKHVRGHAPRVAAAELLPPVRIGDVGVDLVDVVRPADQPALLVVERDDRSCSRT